MAPCTELADDVDHCGYFAISRLICECDVGTFPVGTGNVDDCSRNFEDRVDEFSIKFKDNVDDCSYNFVVSVDGFNGHFEDRVYDCSSKSNDSEDDCGS